METDDYTSAKRSKGTDQLTTLPLKQGKLSASSVISSLTTPKSSSIDLKKYLQLGLLRTFLKSPSVTRSGGTGTFTKYGVSSSSAPRGVEGGVGKVRKEVERKRTVNILAWHAQTRHPTSKNGTQNTQTRAQEYTHTHTETRHIKTKENKSNEHRRQKEYPKQKNTQKWKTHTRQFPHP